MTETYDVFLDYNSEDNIQVAELNTFLKEEFGLRPWFDDDQILPGDPPCNETA